MHTQETKRNRQKERDKTGGGATSYLSTYRRVWTPDAKHGKAATAGSILTPRVAGVWAVCVWHVAYILDYYYLTGEAQRAISNSSHVLVLTPAAGRGRIKALDDMTCVAQKGV